MDDQTKKCKNCQAVMTVNGTVYVCSDCKSEEPITPTVPVDVAAAQAEVTKAAEAVVPPVVPPAL